MKSVDKIRKRSMHFNLPINNHSPIVVRKLIILFMQIIRKLFKESLITDQPMTFRVTHTQAHTRAHTRL